MPCSRRAFLSSFLASAGSATLATLAGGAPEMCWAAQASPARLLPAKADRVILLWLAGGVAHTETFDPKRYVPFEVGLDPARLLCTFPSIPTALDGVQISQGLERIATVLDRATLIRSYRAADLGFILHTRHQYHWHTGYVPPQTVAMPHIGAVIARTLGGLNPDVPPFIHIGQRLGGAGSEEIKAFVSAGFLGAEFSAVDIPEPLEAASHIGPPAGMDLGRFDRRQQFYRKLAESTPLGVHGSDFHRESLLRSFENAYRFLRSPASRAFDLRSEPRATFDIYNTGRFGLGCLLARRLCEVGARFIEVTSEWVQFDNWDTHDDGHRRTIALKKWIDAPIAQLVLDLEQRGLLDSTLIVVASEFSRDLVIEGRTGAEVRAQAKLPEKITEPHHYGLHRHFTGAGSVLLFGGGARRGLVYGATADERPCEVVKDEIQIEDLHATIYRALGIPSDLSYEFEKRPIYVTRDAEGEARMELLSFPQGSPSSQELS